MRIAVIADTHGHLPEHVCNEIREADEIWHLGDFCDQKTLLKVRNLGPHVRAVAGNNDFGLKLPSRLAFEIAGLTFLLVHIPPTIIKEGPDFLLYGHTHVPKDDRVGKTRILNPGSVGKANKGAPASYAWLHLSPDPSSGALWSVRRVAKPRSARFLPIDLADD